MDHNPIVSREEWLNARKLLLTREKELTRAHDELSRQRRELPWVKIDKPYEFDSPTGKVTLAQLFNGRSQLFIKHFMMGPGAAHQCVGCSLEVDHVEGLLEHLENHDVTYVAVARAPIEEIEVVRKRMGWRFPWVSSYHSDFNYDFNVSFIAEQVASGRRTLQFPTSAGMGRWTRRSLRRQRFLQGRIRTRSSTPTRPTAAAANSFSASTDFLM